MTTRFTTNSLGYHGREFSPTKPAGVFRVVTFGGSTTQGLEVNDPDAWPTQLEVLLNTDEDLLKRVGARRVEVINAAVGGWRSLENMLRLRDEVRHFGPDVLLLAFNWNDSWKGLNGLPPDKVTSIERPAWASIKILEYLKIRHGTRKFRDEGEIRRRTAGLRVDAPWAQALERHIEAMNKIASGIHAHVVLVGLPGLCRVRDLDSAARAAIVHMAYDLESGCRFYAALNEFETAFFHQVGRDFGVPVIDVGKAFQPFEGTDRLALFVDVIHFTPKGNRVAAEAVARGLHDLSRVQFAAR